MIDASDPDRFDQVRKQYKLLTKQESLKGKPILIICNKCDSPKFISSTIIKDKILKIEQRCKSPYKIIETSAKLKTKTIIDEGIMFLLLKIDENYDIINKEIESNHKESLKEEKNEIKIQKQRVQDIILSPSSSKMAPGKIRKYADEDQRQNEIEIEDELSRISIIRHNDIDRPSSAPITYIKKYMASQDKYELSF